MIHMGCETEPAGASHHFPLSTGETKLAASDLEVPHAAAHHARDLGPRPYLSPFRRVAPGTENSFSEELNFLARERGKMHCKNGSRIKHAVTVKNYAYKN